MANIDIKFVGAINTVTGSRTEVSTDNFKIMVDCGLFQGPKEIRQKNWNEISEAKKTDAVLLTHAHIDHSGLLPILVRNGFKGPIYCSEPTADLCKILLPDAGRLQEEDANYANARKYSAHMPALPLFTEEEAINVLRLLSPMPVDRWFPLNSKFHFRFSRSGHILGSSFIELSYERMDDTRTLLFSGDLGRKNPILLRERTTVSETDDLVIESTYGDRNHSKGDVSEQLAQIVNTVIGRKGTLVIPAFSVGRTQDILFLLRKLENDGKIDGVKVFLDSPLAVNASDLYLKYPEEIKQTWLQDHVESAFHWRGFTSIRSVDESMLLCMDDSPKIVVSASGMLSGGRVLHHLKAKLTDRKNGVLFLSYQPTGTKGNLLKNGLTKIRIHHQEISVDAEIFSIESLSAHADSDEIIEWISAFRKKPKRIFVNHGEAAAREALAYRLRHELGTNVYLPREGETIAL